MGRQQEADLVGNLVVNGETYRCVKSFCYLGYTLDGADLPDTGRIRNGCIKFRELLPFLTYRVLPLEIKG